MKKKIFMIAALASFGAAMANAHIYHNWQLIDKKGGQGSFGNTTVCQWMCKDALTGKSHFETTTGSYGNCQRPR